MLIDGTAQDGMSQRIAGSVDFIAPENEFMAALGSYNGIQHNG